MGGTMILTADQARARIFKYETSKDPITEIETLASPEARLHEQDLKSDSSGGNPHDVGHHGDVHAHLADVFSKDVSQALTHAVLTHKPDKLYVIAAPRFLGVLRNHWSSEIKAKLTKEFAKDITTATPDAIRTHLNSLLES